MNSITTLVLSFISVNSFSETTVSGIDDFLPLVGCYQSIEYNGKPISGANTQLGSVEQGQAFFGMIRDTNSKPIDSLNVVLFQKMGPKEPEMGLHAIFLDRGVTSIQNSKEFNYQYDGVLRYQDGSDYLDFHIKTKLKITDTGNDLFKVEAFRDIQEFDDFDANERYLLKKVACTQ